MADLLHTGIVQGKATIRSIRRQGDFVTLAVSFPPGSADGIQIGASVAINGTCLTVSAVCWLPCSRWSVVQGML
jgi:riboflavin synthase